jgi:hypothetical protein
MADSSPQAPDLRCPVCGSSDDDNWETEDITLPATLPNWVSGSLPVQLIRCLTCDYLLFFRQGESAEP